MNQFISPHQNININISYNLAAQQKMAKVVFGKKIPKIVKSTNKEDVKPFYKTFKKNEEVTTTFEESKKTKSSKKVKPRKKVDYLLTMPDQEEIQPRRLRTEGNTKIQALSAVLRREPKSNTKKSNPQHFKSLNNQPTTNQSKMKKSINNFFQNTKTSKEERRHSNKSCILSQPKKHILLSDVEHVISTTTHGPTLVQKTAVTKKRANSTTVIRRDNFINKLLDMSVLTSELGGSIPMNEDKAKAEAKKQENRTMNRTALQTFMSSIDMKILKNMERDNKPKKSILSDSGRSDGLELITFLNKIRRIPMDKLHQVATKIQRFWRRKSSQFIMPYYSKMFFRNPAINFKAEIQKNLQQISLIEQNYDQIDDQLSQDEEMELKPCSNRSNGPIIEPVKISESSNYSSAQSSINFNNKEDFQKTVTNLNFNFNKKERIQVKNKLNQQQKQEEQQVSQGFQTNKINIQKYKQLVKKQIQHTKQSVQSSVNRSKICTRQEEIHQQPLSEETRTQSAHWNKVHNILASNMNSKVPLMSKNLLEELMRQSAYNKQWVQGEFSNGEPTTQKKPQSKQPTSQIQAHLTEEKQEQASQDNISQKQVGQFQGQFDEADYNWSKYSDISKIKKPQQILKKSNSLAESVLSSAADELKKIKKIMSIPIPQHEKQQKQQQVQNQKKVEEQQNIIPGLLPSGVGRLIMEQENEEFGDVEMDDDDYIEKDEKWIRQQMIMQDGIVEKYLDCGLDHFDLKLKKVLIDSKQPHQLRKKYNKDPNEGLTKVKQNTNFKQQNQNGKQTEAVREDDIFSNQQKQRENTQDDRELIYVFQNIDKRKFEQEYLPVQQKMQGQKGMIQPIFEIPVFYDSEQRKINEQIKMKRKDEVTGILLAKLIQQFAVDVSVILRRSNNQPLGTGKSNQKKQKQAIVPKVNPPAIPNPNSINGIQSSFQSIRDFLTKLKEFVLNDQQLCLKIIQNIKNNIGPTSIEILTYLRVDDGQQIPQDADIDQQINQQWLFVIPNELFQKFNKKLFDQQEKIRNKKLTNRFKLYTQFWHRSIFQCYNQCLDFQRPFGVKGAPYKWICQPTLPKRIVYSQQKVKSILQSAENRILELSYSSSGIIFDKPQSPYQQFDLNEDQRSQMNQQKISRMLANQILDDEYNWITYNDETTEIIVDISRKIEEIIVFQLSSDIKKIMRRRKMMSCVGKTMSARLRQPNAEDSDTGDQQHAVFMVEDLL